MPKAMIVPARPPAEGSPFHTRFPIVGLLALAVGSARSKCVLLISVRSPPLRERSKTSCHPGKSEKRSENYSKPSANPVLNVRDDTQKRSYTRSEGRRIPIPTSQQID